MKLRLIVFAFLFGVIISSEYGDADVFSSYSVELIISWWEGPITLGSALITPTRFFYKGNIKHSNGVDISQKGLYLPQHIETRFKIKTYLLILLFKLHQMLLVLTILSIGWNFLQFLQICYINILKLLALRKNKCTEEIYWNDQCYLMIDNDLQRNFLQIWSSISTVYETNEIKHYAFVILSVVIKLEVDA